MTAQAAPPALPPLLMNKAAAPYYHGLDMLRAVLMIIGVFWHAVSVIAPTFTFVYSSSHHKSFAIFALVYPEHVFRMESFFLVSGFLALMIRSRKGKAVFFRSRLKRVLLPLLLGCFGANFLLQLFGARYMGFAWEHFDLWRLVMHGWFLITLFVCACLDMLLPERLYRSPPYLQLAAVFLIATAGYCGVLYLNGHYWHLFDPIRGNLFNFLLVNTMQFFPFYYCGALLYAQRQSLHHLTRRQLLLIIALAALSFSLDYLHGIKLINIEDYVPALWGLSYRLLHLCSAGSIAFLLFYACYHMHYSGGAWIRYLIRSAIVVYLLHHPLVIAIAWLFDSPQFTVGQYYLLISAVTLLLSFVLYELIRRFAWTRIAFGLKA